MVYALGKRLYENEDRYFLDVILLQTIANHQRMVRYFSCGLYGSSPTCEGRVLTFLLVVNGFSVPKNWYCIFESL